MSITNTADRIRIESFAKDGTLPTQGVLNANQIKFPTNISTNNGNLEASPTFDDRHIVLRKGTGTEEINLVTSVNVDGVTCTCINDWDTTPASGDAYDIPYIPEDVATVAGCDFETDSRQFVMTKRLIIGVTTTTKGGLGISRGKILRTDDRGAISNLQVNSLGWLLIGIQKNLANGNIISERGGLIIFDKATSSQLAMDIDGHAFMYDFGMFSMRSHEQVVGLTVTHDASATVHWSGFQGHGMDTPYKRRRKRFQDIDGNLLLSITDIKGSAPYNGHLQSELDEILFEYIDDAGEAGANEVMITIEDE